MKPSDMKEKNGLLIRKIFFALGILCLNASLLRAQPERKYYRLRPRWVQLADHIHVHNQRPDGQDQLYMKRGIQYDLVDRDLNNYEQSFSIVGEHAYAIWPLFSPSPDSLYFLANYQNKDSSVYKILLPTAKTKGQSIDESFLKDFLVFHRNPDTPKEIFAQSMSPSNTFKTRSGRVLTLLFCNTGWDANGMRAVLAADIPNGKMIWSYEMGPSVITHELTDLDGDGYPEILMGTYAQNNGVTGFDTKDDSSYVFVLDSENGNLKWKRAVGPLWTGVWAVSGHFRSLTQKDVAVYQFSLGKTLSEQDHLQLFDGRSGKPVSAPRKYGRLFTANWDQNLKICRDFTRDGKDEFVIGNTDGFVRLFNGNLDIVRQSKKYANRIIVCAVEDLTGDGRWEAVCLIPFERIVILNDHLEELCQYPVPMARNTTILSVRGHEKTYLLSGSELNEGTEYHLLELETSLVPFETVKSFRSILYFAALLVFSAGLMIWIRNRYLGKKAAGVFTALLLQADLQDHALTIDRNDRITAAGRQWAVLTGLPAHQAVGEKWQAVFSRPSLQAVKEAIQKMYEQKTAGVSLDFRPGNTETVIPVQIRFLDLPVIHAKCLMIFDLREEEHVRQVKHWAQVAQKLAHGIKNPLTTVKLNAEELLHHMRKKEAASAEEVSGYISPIISEVIKLKKMSDGFMRFVEFEQPDLKPADLNQQINDVVLQCQPGNSRKIQIDWDLDADLPQALIDQKQFEYAVRNVFCNAMESITDTGKIIISTRKVQLFTNHNSAGTGQTYAELQIRDTGCGIPAEFIDRIRQPYFSYNKPEGTGLGLTIVLKIMDSHGGQFDIHSEEGTGTTVSLLFRAVHA